MHRNLLPRDEVKRFTIPIENFFDNKLLFLYEKVNVVGRKMITLF